MPSNPSPFAKSPGRSVLPHRQARASTYPQLLVPALWLAFSKPEDRLAQHAAWWKSVDTVRVKKALTEIKGQAAPSPIHSAITELVGDKAQTRLYVGSGAEPLTYVAIHRNEHGFWYIENPQPYRVSNSKRTGREVVRDGIRVFVVRGEETAALTDFSKLRLERVWSGGRDVCLQLVEDSANPEMQRMLSHSWIIARLLGSVGPTAPLNVYLGDDYDAKVAFSLDRSVGDGWLTPYECTPLRSRPYQADRAEKRVPLVRIVGGLDILHGNALRSLKSVAPILAAESNLGHPQDFRFDSGLTVENEGIPVHVLRDLSSLIGFYGLMPWFILVRRKTGKDDEPRIDENGVPQCEDRIDLPYLRQGERWQEWVAFTYVKSAQACDARVVRRGRYIQDAAPKIHLDYEETPDGKLRVVGFTPSTSFLHLLIDIADPQVADQTTPGALWRRAGLQRVFSRIDGTAPKRVYDHEDLTAFYRRVGCHLSSSRLEIVQSILPKVRPNLG